MSGSRPYDLDEEYSTIVLGTARSPGVVTLSGHDRVKKWDVQEAKGTTGASSKKGGDPIGRFSASFYLADDSPDPDSEEDLNDFERWDNFQRLLEAMDLNDTALPIYHPDLARNHFTEVAVESIGGMVHDGKGGATVLVKFIEYRPEKPHPVSSATAKPAAPGAAFGPPKPDPNAEAKATLAALVEQAKSI